MKILRNLTPTPAVCGGRFAQENHRCRDDADPGILRNDIRGCSVSKPRNAFVAMGRFTYVPGRGLPARHSCHRTIFLGFHAPHLDLSRPGEHPETVEMEGNTFEGKRKVFDEAPGGRLLGRGRGILSSQ